jgi:hypothetical protein
MFFGEMDNPRIKTGNIKDESGAFCHMKRKQVRKTEKIMVELYQRDTQTKLKNFQ